eukprot:s3351_g5.t1
MSDGGREFEGALEMVLRAFQVYHDIVPPTAHWRMALGERHGAVLKLMIMRVIKEKSISGLDEVKSAVVASTAARNLQARVAGYSPMQLVFGKENPFPGNIMDTLENGYMHYQLADPLSVEDSFRRSLDIRRAAEEAFRWIQSSDALRRAATSRARLPKLETLVEGSMVMFWEPPANRRGLSRRLQDDVSWVGPAIVVAIERKEGAVKRVWVRYRTKLKGLPLEFIRLAVTDEIQAQDISMEAFKDLEKDVDFRAKSRMLDVEVYAHPQVTDKQYPVMEFSDEEPPPHPDQAAAAASSSPAALLDDVPLQLRRPVAADAEQAQPKRQRNPPGFGPDGDPSTWPLPQRRSVFEKPDGPSAQAAQTTQRTRQRIAEVKEKVQPTKKQRLEHGGSRRAKSVGAVMNVMNVESELGRHPFDLEGGESESLTEDEPLPQATPMTVTPFENYMVAMDIPQLRQLPELRHWPSVENTSYLTLLARYVQYGPDLPNLNPLPASPLTTLRMPRMVGKYMEMPDRLREHLDVDDFASLHEEWRRHEADFWLWRPQQQELWRVHKIERRQLFDPFRTQGQVPPWPHDLPKEWFRGPRSTVVFTHLNIEVLVDNFLWLEWNTSQDLGRPWVGVTRFWVCAPPVSHQVLATWVHQRTAVEDMWREGLQMLHDFHGGSGGTWSDVFHVQAEVCDLMDVFINQTRLPQPKRLPEDEGVRELQLQVPDLPTGKARLELKWHALSPQWKEAFQDPIKDALDVYFKYEAIAPVFPGDEVDQTRVLPSRFVLVNKSDPRNCSPLDSQIKDAKLKARWVVAGHKDGENLDPKRIVVLVAIPRGYPDFVQQFLATKLPPGARSDLVRFTKGGFGLAESPRLWFKKLQRTVQQMGAREWLLIPGVFSFFHEGKVIAMLACHVDDIRMIGHPELAQPVWEKLKEEFTFGEWRDAQGDWVKFCGRYERQLADFTVEIQMDHYGDKVEYPPRRDPNGVNPLTLTEKEKKWIGHVCGQLNWLARQCRGDLLFGVSRVQQLAGVEDPQALEELYILVERAKIKKGMKFSKLDCDLEHAVILAASDASFGGMPRGRSQGGGVLMIANCKILEGTAKAVPIFFHSALLKRIVRSSLAAEISQAAETLDQADFLRAVIAEATIPDFSIKQWMIHSARWRLISVLDSRTGYDLLNGANHGDDRRLAIDVASMKESLHENGAARLVRWVPGAEQVADDLTKLIGNNKLSEVLAGNLWSLRDNEESKTLRSDAAARKKRYRQRIAQHRDADSYVVAINPQGDATRLCLWLMSPGVLFEVFASQAHAVLLASGTLAPLGALQAELMASDASLASRALQEGPLEARHIVHPWQLFAAVLPCANSSNAQPIVSTYGNWQSEEFVQAVGMSVLQLVSCIPGGVLCFLPSYQAMDLALLVWRRSGLWQELAKVKALVTEPRQAAEMQDAARQFMAGVKDGHGALCFAVYRGKMSEGLDFSDDLCRAVICIGVPYPQMNDPVVVAKRRWNDATRAGRGRLSGEQWYELQAHRAVNQALGRLLRHGRDYGALYLGLSVTAIRELNAAILCLHNVADSADAAGQYHIWTYGAWPSMDVQEHHAG